MAQHLQRPPDRDGSLTGSPRSFPLGSVPHMRLHAPHRARATLSALRVELKALYEELSAALLPNGKGRR